MTDAERKKLQTLERKMGWHEPDKKVKTKAGKVRKVKRPSFIEQHQSNLDTCPACGRMETRYGSFEGDGNAVTQAGSCSCGASWVVWWTHDTTILLEGKK